MESLSAMRETSGRLDRPDGEQIAWRRVDGRGPTVVWLGGFRSDMTGTKAQALAIKLAPYDTTTSAAALKPLTDLMAKFNWVAKAPDLAAFFSK